jgi:hypothetical protein
VGREGGREGGGKGETVERMEGEKWQGGKEGGREGGKEGGRKSPTTYQLCPLQLGVEQAGKVAMQALISRNELIRKGQPLFNICSR